VLYDGRSLRGTRSGSTFTRAIRFTAEKVSIALESRVFSIQDQQHNALSTYIANTTPDVGPGKYEISRDLVPSSKGRCSAFLAPAVVIHKETYYEMVNNCKIL